MRKACVFLAAAAVALTAPMTLAQGASPAAAPAATAPAAVSTGYVEIGPVTVKRGDQLIKLNAGESCFLAMRFQAVFSRQSSLMGSHIN